MVEGNSRINGTWQAQLAKSSPIAFALLVMASLFIWSNNQESGRNRESLHELKTNMDLNTTVSRETSKALDRLNEELIRRNILAESTMREIEGNTKNIERVALLMDKLIEHFNKAKP